VRRSIRSAAISAVLVAALAAVAVAAPDRAKAREHFVQAEMYMKTGVYDQAVIEYEKAYELAPDAHGFLFNIGLAYEKWGKKEKAVAAYTDYLDKEPGGKKAPEARARKIALERALAAEADRRARENPDPGPVDPSPAEPSPAEPIARPPVDAGVAKPARSEGVSWGRLAIGATAVAAGLIVDFAPDSSSNGALDALDFVPIGLYSAGAFFVYTGVF
jgi:tetratricopeptide (TPR) repeat protein